MADIKLSSLSLHHNDEQYTLYSKISLLSSLICILHDQQNVSSSYVWLLTDSVCFTDIHLLVYKEIMYKNIRVNLY